MFFGDFSAARPRFVARHARSDSPQSRGPCPRAHPPHPRPSRSASEVPRSPTRALITALFRYNDQSVGVLQPHGHALSFCLFLVLDRHDHRVTTCVHRRNTGRTSRIATLLCCLSVLAFRVVIWFRFMLAGGDTAKMGRFVVSADY